MIQLNLFSTKKYELSYRISPTSSYTIWDEKHQIEAITQWEAVESLRKIGGDAPIEIYRLDPYIHPKLRDTRYHRVMVWESDAAYEIRSGDDFEITPKHLAFLREP